MDVSASYLLGQAPRMSNLLLRRERVQELHTPDFIYGLFVSSLRKVIVYVPLVWCPTSSGLASLLVLPLPTTEFYFFIPPLHTALLHPDALLIARSSVFLQPQR